MALNVKQKYPGTQGGAAQLYASDTRLSLRRREQVFTRLSKSYKENMDISSTRSSSSSSSSDEEIIVLLNEERRPRRFKKDDAFTRAVFRVGVQHSHWPPFV